MRILSSLLALAAFAACGPVAKEGGEVTGPLTRERLVAAGEAAGFTVRDAKADIPGSARSNLTFTAIAYDSPRLATLREKFGLEKAIAEARDEWTAQLLLKEWVHRAIPGGTPRVTAPGAIEILDHAARGEKFWCTQYAMTYAECALALGWLARKIAVDRKHGPEGRGSTHHGVAEVWSNRFCKWVVIDPQSNLHFEKNGVPLSAWDIRAEWLRDGGKAVDHVVGVPPRATRKNPAILWWDRPDEDETATYFWLYIMDHVAGEGSQGAKYIFPQDGANEGLTWYQNDSATKGSRLHTGYQRGFFLPTRRIEDAYWTVGIVEAAITGAAPGAIQMRLEAAPEVTGFESSFDGKSWTAVRDPGAFRWNLTSGSNVLRLRTAGRRDVRGPEIALRLELD